MPVGGIAILGAGGILGIGLGHRVTRSRNLFSLHGGFNLAVGILKCLAAGGAAIILVVAILSAGGSLSVGLGQGVRDLVNDFLRNQNLITDGAMRTLGQACLCAGSCNSGIDHGGVGFLFQSFSFNRCGLRTGLILENLVADRAGVVSIVALCRAGGFLGVGLGHRVMCFDNGIVQGNLGGAVLVGEVLVAYAAMPVGGIAVLGAGGILGIGLGHLVSRSRNLFGIDGGCDLAIGILKDLAASGAAIILVVAILGAGGSLGVGLGHLVSRSRNLFGIDGGCDLAIGILKDLAASGAAIILVVAILGAGGSLGIGLGHRVTRGCNLFSLNGSFLRTVLILENLTASRAGVVSVVAFSGAGGLLGIGLGHRVMRLDNGVVQGDFGGAVLIGEILVAYAAMPVGGIAVLRAGGNLGISFY